MKIDDRPTLIELNTSYCTTIRITPKSSLKTPSTDSFQYCERLLLILQYSKQCCFVRNFTVPRLRLPKFHHFNLSSVLLTNLRSMINKFDEITFKMADLAPDIVIFTETWLNDCIPSSSLQLNNYSIVRRDRNNTGGGIACYISDKLRYRVVDESEFLPVSQYSSELLTVLFLNTPLLLISVYHPYSVSYTHLTLPTILLV